MMAITTNDLVKLCRQWYEVLRRVENGSIPLTAAKRSLQDLIERNFMQTQTPHWYVTPSKQLENVRRWNEDRRWGFVEADCPLKVPDFTPSSPLEVLVLSVYLPDEDGEPGYIRTANELWELTRVQQYSSSSQQWRIPYHDTLRLLPGTEHHHRPGIRWNAVDLGAHWDDRKGVCPLDVRGHDSAHAEVLAAAAHSPGWIQAMDGVNIPYVLLAGYQATLPGYESWMHIPLLENNRPKRMLRLDVRWHDRSFSDCAIPVRKEL